MKKKLVVVLLSAAMCVAAFGGCGAKSDSSDSSSNKKTETSSKKEDQKAADAVAKKIDAIYVQERTDKTDEQCKAAKEAWDKLTDAQKELVEGDNADPDYFGRDTGDASKDDPLNGDDIGEKELLVVSFGTSFNASRAADIGGVEKALQAANPDWSVRRAFTAQIIINHVQARDGEKIDNVDQALERAVKNGVKQLIIQPTHLMHGAEYKELTEAVESYKDKFESVKIAEPLLGEVGSDATVINADKAAVAEAITAEAVKTAEYDSLDAAAAIGGGMADLLTAPIWAPATIIIKALISIPFTSKSDKIMTVRNVVSTIIAFAISATGYAIAEAFITYGFTKQAFTGLIAIIPVSVPGSCIQSGGSAIIFVILGLVLDKIGFKRRFFTLEETK